MDIGMTLLSIFAVLFISGMVLFLLFCIGLSVWWNGGEILANSLSKRFDRKHSLITPYERWGIRRYAATIQQWEALHWQWYIGDPILLKVWRTRDNGDKTHVTTIYSLPDDRTDRYGYSLVEATQQAAISYLMECSGSSTSVSELDSHEDDYTIHRDIEYIRK